MTIPLGATIAAAALAIASPAPAQSGRYHVKLGYSGRLIIKVLDITVEERASAASHSSTARMVSSGLLAKFRKLDTRASSRGRIGGGRPMPGDFVQQNLAGKTRRRTTVDWQGGGKVAVTATPAYFDLGDPPATQAQQAAAADPLTQLMRMTLNGSRATVCRQSYRFFDGKQLYDVRMSNPQPTVANAREKRLGLQGLIACDARFSEVAGFKRKSGKERNQGLDRPIRVVFGQAGADGPLVISTVRAHTPLGQAVIELDRLSVTGDDPTG
ncbi:MAG TPA: hypothetical protein VF559_01310 [Caulobacteraceae bacterium]|jgi:hypothetical protein